MTRQGAALFIMLQGLNDFVALFRSSVGEVKRVLLITGRPLLQGRG